MNQSDRPSRHIRSRRFVLAAAAVLLAAGTAAAGEVELSAYWTRFHPRINSTYVHSFRPPFESGFSSGSGGQTLTLKADRASGWSLSLNVSLGGRFGVQALFSTFTTVLRGTSSPYAATLDYEARQPPDYVLRGYTYVRTDDWVAPAGEIDQFNFSLNGLVEFEIAAGLLARVSAGPTYYSLAGTAGPLGFTQFRLGGHAVLFSDTSSLVMNVARTVRLGANTGAELVFWVIRDVGVAVEARYFSCPEAKARVELEVQDESQLLWPVNTDAFDAEPLVLNPSFFRLSFGFKVRI